MDINNICNSLSCVKIFSFIDNCITVKLREKILAKLCLDGVNGPVDGFVQISEKVAPGEILTLFDNSLDQSPLPNKMQSRGIFVVVTYPSKDDNNETVDDTKKSSNIIVSNKLAESFALPVYNFYSLINNPVSENTAQYVNTTSIENPNDFSITVNALILLTNKTGVSTAPSSC